MDSGGIGDRLAGDVLREGVYAWFRDGIFLWRGRVRLLAT